MKTDPHPPHTSVVNGDAVEAHRPEAVAEEAAAQEAAAREVVARAADGRVLLRRPKTALELAIEVHGPVQQTAEWLVHPACADPPAHFGVCTYRFADGLRWCFKCEDAWLP